MAAKLIVLAGLALAVRAGGIGAPIGGIGLGGYGLGGIGLGHVSQSQSVIAHSAPLLGHGYAASPLLATRAIAAPGLLSQGVIGAPTLLGHGGIAASPLLASRTIASPGLIGYGGYGGIGASSLIGSRAIAGPGLLSHGAIAAPLALAAPAVHAKAVVDSYDPHPQYSFNYAVQDAHTGDQKTQQETRNGDVVQGSYSLVEPDGSIRTVEYTADDHNGFNAIVHRTAGAHPAPLIAKAVHAGPALLHH